VHQSNNKENTTNDVDIDINDISDFNWTQVVSPKLHIKPLNSPQLCLCVRRYIALLLYMSNPNKPSFDHPMQCLDSDTFLSITTRN